jgi:hypothetical protein
MIKYNLLKKLIYDLCKNKYHSFLGYFKDSLNILKIKKLYKKVTMISF